MKNKIVLLIVFSVLLLSNGLWFIDSIPSKENSFWLDFFSFCFIGIAFIFTFYFFNNELKKISDKIWKPLAILTIICGSLLINGYGSRTSVSEDGVLGLFKHPVTWMLMASAVGYLVLFFYNRNKPQSN